MFLHALPTVLSCLLVQDASRDAARVLGADYVRAARPIRPEERANVDIEVEEPRLKARRARIVKELESLGTPDWAGTYYQGDGLGTNVTLVLAPEGGATYTWTGCLGLYDCNQGNIA